MKVFKNCILVFHSYFLDILLSHEQTLTVPSRSNSANFRHCNFLVSANNKKKVEEQTTEEFYTSSFEEIPGNGLIADAIILQYKKEESICLTTEMKRTSLS